MAERRLYLDFSDLIVLGEPVVIEDGEDQRLVEGLAVGNLTREIDLQIAVKFLSLSHPLERECFVEEGIQRLAMHFRLELPLLVRHQIDLQLRSR